MRISLIIIGFLLFFIHSPSLSQKADSIYLLISKSDDQDSTAYWQEQIGNIYFNSDFDSARYHYRKALPFYKDPEHDLKKASLLKRMAISFALHGRQDSAIHYMAMSLQYYEEINDSLQMAYSHNNLGLMYADKSQYMKSMEHLLEAHKIKTKLQEKYSSEKLDLPGTELNIGITFHYMEDFQNAGNYYLMARRSYEGQKDSFGILNAQLQIANLHSDLEQYAEAKDIYQHLIEDPRLLANPVAYRKLMNNYATLLFKIENFYEAERILKEAFRLNTESGHWQSAVKNLNNLAEIFVLQKDYDQALDYGQQSLQLCRTNGFQYSEQVVLGILADAYEGQGEFRQALKMHQFKEVLTDSLYNIEKNSLATEMETRYQSVQKEKEIALKNMEIDRVNKSRLWFILLSLLLVIFAVVFFVLFTDRRKKNHLLKQSIRTKDKLISIIAHDLKNPAIAQKMAIQNLLQYIDHLKKEDIQPQLQALYQSSESQVSLLNNLLNWAHSQTGRIEYKPVYFELDPLIQKNIELFKTTATNKGISFEVKGDDGIVVFADKPSINTILRNLISNAIKFSYRGKTISLVLDKRDNNHLICSVVDQGVGLSKDKINRLFDVAARELSSGTDGEQGSGLGLILCKELVEKNGGSLYIESEEGKGSVVSFSIPLLSS
jgi:two-component system sensor histidine kinase/response regulator